MSVTLPPIVLSYLAHEPFFTTEYYHVVSQNTREEYLSIYLFVYFPFSFNEILFHVFGLSIGVLIFV